MYDKKSIEENANITDLFTNWNKLFIKEVLHMKLKKLVLDSRLKASKEL